MPSQSTGSWVSSTADPRALQKLASEDRMAPHWYGPSDLSFDIHLKDGQSHQLSVYCLDWDSDARIQTIEIKDASNQKVLDSRRISNFRGGQYLSWKIGGDVTVSVTRVAGANAVISAIFLD